MSKFIPTCTHHHANGRRCGSPSLRGEPFCFYHHPTRRPPARTPARAPFYVEAITDPETLQMALSEVIRRLADNTIDARRAGLLLITLQMAKANLGSLPRYPAREAEETSPDSSDLSRLLPELGLHLNPLAPKA